MTETGRVREIKGTIVIVVPDMNAACFGCMNQECKTSGFISAENPKALSLETGQSVEVSAPGISLLGQVMAALLLPAFGFAAGFFLAHRLFPGAGEGAAAGIGVIFLFAAAFVIYKIRKKYPAKMVYEVTRIL